MLAATAALALLPCLFGSSKHLQIHKVLADLHALESALQKHAARTGSFPDSATGLQALLPIEIVRVRPDPWGNGYYYRLSDEPQVYSAGVNGLDEGGRGDDIITSPKEYDCDVYGVDCGFRPHKDPIHAVGLMVLISLGVGIARCLRWAWRSIRA